MVVVGEGSVAVVVGVSASLLVLALMFFLIQLPGRGGPFDLDDVGSVFCFSNIFILSLMLLIVGTAREWSPIPQRVLQVVVTLGMVEAVT